ncbi:MAG: Translation initiation factor IF-3 [Fimbriimonadaceae bacterium]|nr:Translation initiation factor IF-3 [Fimbriimonadaceae bacterium]
MVAPTAQPPVCKIIDHGKYKYQQEKLNKENKKVKQDVKGIKLRPGTAEHDLKVLMRNAMKFLEEGHKVKVTCQFRAREVTHPEFGYQKMNKLAEELSPYSIVEKAPSLEGKLMTMILLPKAGSPKKKDAKDQDQQNGSEKVQGHGKREDHAPEVEQQSHVLPQEREPEASTGTGT